MALRVVLRRFDDLEGDLLGEFKPLEITDLIQLIKRTDIYDENSEHDPATPGDVVTQFVSFGQQPTARAVLEIVWFPK